MKSEFKGRREDDRLLTGAGRYAADWNLPGQLHACFLRSDRAHAEIASIDVKPAVALPGVIAVLTGDDADIAAIRTPKTNVSFPGRGGAELKLPHRPCLARGKAWASVAMGAPSRALGGRAKDNPAFFITLAATAGGKFLPQTGGVLIKDETGTVIGAAGASGGTGDEGEACCIHGIRQAGLTADPAA